MPKYSRYRVSAGPRAGPSPGTPRRGGSGVPCGASGTASAAPIFDRDPSSVPAPGGNPSSVPAGGRTPGKDASLIAFRTWTGSVIPAGIAGRIWRGPSSRASSVPNSPGPPGDGPWAQPAKTAAPQSIDAKPAAAAFIGGERAFFMPPVWTGGRRIARGRSPVRRRGDCEEPEEPAFPESREPRDSAARRKTAPRRCAPGGLGLL